MSNQIMCEAKELFFTYSGKKNDTKYTLENISFTLKKGEMLGLVGESGSGKSTLAKVLVGLYKPIAGECMCQNPQMVFQDSYSALNPAKTVGWLLHEAQKLQGVKDKTVREKAIREILDEVELEEVLLERFPNELSGGQRQRVMIAMALLAKPEVLIADEPVSALDVTIQKQIIGLLKKLGQKRNLTILFISHDLRTVYQLCNKIMVMKSGKVVESDTINEVYFNPKHEYTKELLSSAGIDWE